MGDLALAGNRALESPVQARAVMCAARRRPAPLPKTATPKISKDTAGLEDRLGYHFSDRSLLETALTHQSALDGHKGSGESYQRLEFLGDRVLGLAISDKLYRLRPQVIVGRLARRLSDLVRWETCAEVADEWNLGEYIRFAGNIGPETRQSRSVLADVCEAVLGAVYLDGGLNAAFRIIDQYWSPRLAEDTRRAQDPKTALQEWAQARGLAPPKYHDLERSGPDHEPVFTVAVDIADYPVCEGRAPSKKYAQQAAAEAFLLREAIWTPKS